MKTLAILLLSILPFICSSAPYQPNRYDTNTDSAAVALVAAQAAAAAQAATNNYAPIVTNIATAQAQAVVSNGLTGVSYQQAAGVTQTSGSTAQVNFLTPASRNLPPQLCFSPGFAVICTESNCWWLATNAIADGLYSYGWNTIVIAPGWIGGRDGTGHIYSNTNNFPHGVSNTVFWLHSIGFNVQLFMEPTGTNSLGGPLTPLFGDGNDGTNIIFPLSWQSNDVCDFRSWGIDSFMIAGLSGTSDANFQRFINEAYFQAFKTWYPACPVGFIMANITNSDAILSYLFPATAATSATRVPSWMLNEEDFCPLFAFEWGTFSNWQKIFNDWTIFTYVGNCFGPTKHPYSEGDVTLNSWETRTYLNMEAMVHAWMTIGSGEAFLYTNFFAMHTNIALLNIDRDLAYDNPRLIMNNGTNCEAWSERLADGSMAILIINNTNFPQTVTVPISSVTLYSRTNPPPAVGAKQTGWLLQDLWANNMGLYASGDYSPLNNLWFTNSFTFTTTTNYPAGTAYNSFLFKLTPDYNIKYQGDELLNGPNVILKLSFNNGSLNDDSIYNWPILTLGGTTIVTNGIRGSGIAFNGSTYYTIGYLQSPGIGIIGGIGTAVTNGDWSISGWLSYTNTSSGVNLASILGGNSSLDAFDINIYSSNQVTIFSQAAGGSPSSYLNTTFSGVNFADGNYHHYVYSCANKTNITIYVDVTNQYSAAFTFQPGYNEPENVFCLGANRVLTANPASTRLDEFYMYSRSFTSNDVFDVNRLISPK